MCSFVRIIFQATLIFGNMAAKGDVFMNCIGPCSDTYDHYSCYNDCVERNEGAGFCYPKLGDDFDEKDCCCNY